MNTFIRNALAAIVVATAGIAASAPAATAGGVGFELSIGGHGGGIVIRDHNRRGGWNRFEGHRGGGHRFDDRRAAPRGSEGPPHGRPPCRRRSRQQPPRRGSGCPASPLGAGCLRQSAQLPGDPGSPLVRTIRPDKQDPGGLRLPGSLAVNTRICHRAGPAGYPEFTGSVPM